MPSKIRKPTSFHWGSYYAETENEKLVGMRPYENDKDPSRFTTTAAAMNTPIGFEGKQGYEGGTSSYY